jgi:AAA family ATP:ADP antiporter
MRHAISQLRILLFPIQAKDLNKFVPMCLLTFLVLLNINIVRGARDSLVVTQIGSEVLSFIKLWVEMPIGVVIVLIYNRLSNLVGSETIFRALVSFFLLFFLLFAFVLLPCNEYFHPNLDLINIYLHNYPNLQWFILMWSKWSYVLFYIMGELWAVIVYSLLFWQLANKITRVSEASRFYILFSLFGQINLLVSGRLIKYFTTDTHFLAPFLQDYLSKTELVIKSLTLVFVMLGILSLFIHRYIEVRIIRRELDIVRKSPEKLKLNMRESLKTIFRSNYLGMICIMVIGYSASINLIEGILMCKTRELYPRIEDFLNFQGSILFYTGIFTLFCSILGGAAIRKLGWLWGAISTPTVFMVTGVMFFISAHLSQSLHISFPLSIVVFCGGLYTVLSKGTKYALFDATKEMAYIPLDIELRVKGKAAVDVVGVNIGKSLGAVIQFLCFTLVPSTKHKDILGLLSVMFVIVCVAWLYAVIVLAKKYKKLSE